MLGVIVTQRILLTATPIFLNPFLSAPSSLDEFWGVRPRRRNHSCSGFVCFSPLEMGIVVLSRGDISKPARRWVTTPRHQYFLASWGKGPITSSLRALSLNKRVFPLDFQLQGLWESLPWKFTWVFAKDTILFIYFWLTRGIWFLGPWIESKLQLWQRRIL